MNVRHTLALLGAILALPAHSAIRGVVMTTSGLPLANARVEAFAPESREARITRFTTAAAPRTAIAAATADAKGSFSLDVKGQPYSSVTVDVAGYEPSTITSGPDEDLGAVALRSAANRSGVIRGGGKPLSGATVITVGTERLVRTDSEGRYTLADPTIWAQSMRVYHPDFAPMTVPLASGKSLDVSLDSGRAIRGRVVGADGTTGVGGAAIWVDGWKLATSAADGSFTVKNAPATWREVEAETTDMIAAVTRKSGDAALTLRLAKGSFVAGVLRDAKTQKPVSGGRVTVRSRVTDPAPLSVSSDAKGAFSLGPLSAGRHDLVAFTPGYNFTPSEVDVRGGTNAQKVISGTQTATVSGSVVDENKKAVTAALITTKASGEGEMNPMRAGRMTMTAPVRAWSAPDGRFVLRGVTPDTPLTVEGERKGTPSGKSGPHRFASGELKSGVIITIPNGVTVSGIVTDAAGRPVSGARITATESEGDRDFGMMRMVIGGPAAMGRDLPESGSDGRFSLKLVEGTYDFTFIREGFAARRVRARKVTASGTEPIEVSLVAGSEVSGRITRKGVGVPDVNVIVMGENTLPRPVQTGVDGSFTIPDLPVGQMMLIANKFEEGIREQRSVTAPSREVLIELPPGGRITGRVLDKSTKNPITTFRAGMSNNRSGGGMVIRMPPSLQNFRSDDGSFVLENVAVGATELIVEAPGFIRGRTGGMSIEEGKTVADVEILLETGTTITGRVTGSDGAALAGADVRIESGEGGAFGGPMAAMMSDGPQTSTDGNGDFSIEAVEAGEKTLVFRKNGYQAERKSVRVSGKEQKVDARLTKGRDLVGTVVTDTGSPVAGATVSANSAIQDAGPRSARSDENGTFRFEGMTPGRYRISASKPGLTNGEVKDFDIESNAPLRVVMQGGGIITGRVIGLTEAELSATRISARAGSKVASAQPEPSGEFRIEGAPIGTVRVAAEVQGLGSFRNSPSKSVELTTGAQVNVDLEFDQNVTIRGRVSRDGKASGNAMVMFLPTNRTTETNASTRTDANGDYSISGLLDGKYDVRVVDMARFTPYSTSYEVRGSGTFDIEIRGTSLRGRVIDASSSEPLRDATVTIQEVKANDSGFMGGRTITTDAAGGFSLETVAEGRYRARAQKEKYGQQILEVNVTEGTQGELEFKLQRNDGLALKIVDARDNRIINGFVSVVDAQGRTAYEGFARATADDVVRLPLAAGSYRVRITAQGYAPRTINLASPSADSVRIGLTPGGSLLIRNDSGETLRAKLVSSAGVDYRMGGFVGSAEMRLDRGTRMLDNIEAGSYAIQILNEDGSVKKSVSATVVEGQVAEARIPN